MKTRGFTLIELLAVIVILAIIALIATPIILGIISDARNEAKIKSAELVYKGVEYAYSQVRLNKLNGNSVTLEDINSKIKIENVVSTRVNGDTLEIVTKDGVYCGVTKNDETKKIDVVCGTDSTDFTKTDVMTRKSIAYGKAPTPWTVVEVSGICGGEKSVTIEDESFCVIKETGNSIVLLTEKYIKKSTTSPGQTTDYANNKTTYSTSNYWQTGYTPYGSSSYVYVYDDHSIVYDYIEKYAEHVAELIDRNDITVEGRLLSYEETQTLGCSGSNCSAAPSWIYSPTTSSQYWLGSAIATTAPMLWNVSSDTNTGVNSFTLVNASYLGIRPVITITQS